MWQKSEVFIRLHLFLLKYFIRWYELILNSTGLSFISEQSLIMWLKLATNL